MSPKLSVGIPVYNQAATIGETIESLLDQQVAPFEIVVCDNHSTDGTSTIIKTYSHRVKIVSPPVHLSLAQNFNFCFQQLSGDWLSFICGDDLAYPNYVRVLMSLAAGAQDHVVVVTANCDAYYEQSGLKMPYVRLSMRPGENSGKKMTGMSLFAAKVGMTLSSACRSEAVHRVGGFDERFTCIDYALEYDLGFQGAFVYSREIICAYRMPLIEHKRQIQLAQDHARFVIHKIPQASANGVSLSIMIKAAIAHLMPYVSGDNALASDHPAMQDLYEALATLGRLKLDQSSRIAKFWNPFFTIRRKVIEVIRQLVVTSSSRKVSS